MSQGTLQLGTYFGPYLLQRLIAVGGMAEIYLARTKGLAGFEKQLALKVIHPDYVDDKSFIQMLVNEAKIAVGLNHHNIAQTFDLGQIGERYFISMEFVDGMDLFQLLKRLTELNMELPVEAAVYVVQEALNGLEYAHSKADDQGNPLKIIHRDMSPQNILCSRHGEVKIIDFGIAKAVTTTNKTRAGVIKGKLVYMSPEQAWGDPVDHRTDIFSAGIVLYEALTCGSLYLEKNPVKLLEMVRKAEIKPPSHRRRDVTDELDALTMRALSPRPPDRYQSARDFAAALSEYLHQHAPEFGDEQLGQLVESALSGDPGTADFSVSKMARDDFAVQEHSIIFSADEMLSSAPLSARPRLAKARARLLLFENGEAKPFDVEEQFIIGRSGDLRLGDARVSRRHARIYLLDRVYNLEDLGSANGTYLNDEKIQVPARLQSGDIIRVGPFEMRFVIDDAAAAAQPPAPAAEAIEPDATPASPQAEELAQSLLPQPPVPPPRAVSPIDLTDKKPAADNGVWLAVRFGEESLRLQATDSMPLAHDLLLGDQRLAGEAATLVRRADGYWLEPAEAGQPVMLNGAAVSTPTPVRPGDTLLVGPLRIEIEK